MKTVLPHYLGVLIVGSIFMFSCARPLGMPTHLPPGNLPRIDGKKTPESRKESGPAIVQTMITRAEQYLGRNQPEKAFQTLERALALDGRDPMVWHLMARARQIQGQYGQAASLAKKSNTLAGANVSLMEKNLEIILEVTEKKGPPL